MDKFYTLLPIVLTKKVKFQLEGKAHAICIWNLLQYYLFIKLFITIYNNSIHTHTFIQNYIYKVFCYFFFFLYNYVFKINKYFHMSDFFLKNFEELLEIYFNLSFFETCFDFWFLDKTPFHLTSQQRWTKTVNIFINNLTCLWSKFYSDLECKISFIFLHFST